MELVSVGNVPAPIHGTSRGSLCSPPKSLCALAPATRREGTHLPSITSGWALWTKHPKMGVRANLGNLSQGNGGEGGDQEGDMCSGSDPGLSPCADTQGKGDRALTTPWNFVFWLFVAAGLDLDDL